MNATTAKSASEKISKKSKDCKTCKEGYKIEMENK